MKAKITRFSLRERFTALLDKKIAETVLGRAKGYCERCGVPSHDLALHHRKLKSRGGKDEVANLVAVCHKCHNLGTESIHLNPKKATDKGWMVSAYQDPSDVVLHIFGRNPVRLDQEGNYIEGDRDGNNYSSRSSW